MKAVFAVLVGAVTLAAVGCNSKGEARTGKEFLEKFQQAEKNKDVDAYWKLMSTKTQKSIQADIQKEVDAAKKDEKTLAALKKKYAVEDDPTKMKTDDLAKAMLKKQLESKKSDFLDAKFVEEKAGDAGVTLIIEVPGKGNREVVLVKEKELLKIDWKSTMDKWNAKG